MKKTIAPLMSSKRQEWNTPEPVLELARAMGRIVLDPCGNSGSIVGAKEEWRYERGEDGLVRQWNSDLGVCFVNPPYYTIEQWTYKMSVEGHRGVQIVALVPARTDTQWWHRYIIRADAICFWEGRLRFLGAEGSAPFPSAVAYWGSKPNKFARIASADGWVVR